MFVCPYCANPDATQMHCGRCQRNPSAPRRVCNHCHKMTPQGEPRCAHCSVPFGNELSWKIPLIIGLFLAAFAIAIALQLG